MITHNVRMYAHIYSWFITWEPEPAGLQDDTAKGEISFISHRTQTVTFISVYFHFSGHYHYYFHVTLIVDLMIFISSSGREHIYSIPVSCLIVI